VGRLLAEMAIDGEARTAVEAGVELGHFKINRFKGKLLYKKSQKSLLL
jgi:sarcosine oxidase / L-pipecolate oxidase